MIFKLGGTMKNILIIEDDESLSRGISYYLNNNGYITDIVNNLKAADNQLKRKIYNLIILDINLPDGNGFDYLSSRLKDIKIPVLILTANNGEFDEVMGLELGAEDYISKPFSLAVLKARVDRIIKRRDDYSTINVEQLVSGDVVLDIRSYKFFGKGVEIPLSKTEFKLIKILLENKGQVLEKEQILTKLWDDEGNFVDDNTVAVNISRIRKKLDDQDINSKTIKTIHGIGYKWEE